MIVIKFWLSAIIGFSLVLLPASCQSQASKRYSRKKAQESLKRLGDPGLLIGNFSLARKKPVVDGDTIRVDGLDTTLRLLGIDTEEKYRNNKDRRKAESDWQGYLREKRSKSNRPPKMGTPMGIAATNWAKKFFEEVDILRLERDDPKQVRGRFNRYLSYVFAKKNGQWINYNIECVRAGMSPYFTKYGYSKRFHKEFRAAEKQAKAAKRGIWDPKAKSYGDYDRRRIWWDARANFIRKFYEDSKKNKELIVLTDWDAITKIEQNLNKEVEILGTVGNIRRGDRGPTKVMLSRRMFNDFPIIFFDKDVFGNTGLMTRKREFVRIRGFVNKYHNKRKNRHELQIIVNTPGQVTLSEIPNELTVK